MRALLAAILLACSASTLGCRGDSLELGSDAELGVNADSDLIRIEEGATITLAASVHHPEFEGSTDFAVVTLTSDDPSVVEIAPDSRFTLRAVSVGETVLRAETDSYPSAYRAIRVVPKAR